MDIKLIIPQREPMIMIDDIISHTETETVTSFQIMQNNIFVENNIFQSSGLIENIAQSSAARMGMQTIKDRKEPLLGYIASIKNMNIKYLPKVGETIQTEIIISNEINNIIVVQGKSKVGNNLISNCELKVFIEI